MRDKLKNMDSETMAFSTINMNSFSDAPSLQGTLEQPLEKKSGQPVIVSIEPTQSAYSSRSDFELEASCMHKSASRTVVISCNMYCSVMQECALDLLGPSVWSTLWMT